MEDFIDFKRIKEEIIETDSIIKKNAELEKNILTKKKQLKQLTNDFKILKLEYEYKQFQFDEKKKQCDNFKTDNLNLESENTSIKEEYNKTLNDYQVLHIKYQTMCKDLEESLESLEKCKITDSPVKVKTRLKKRKREISETFDDNADSGSDFSAESDEEGKLLEKKLSEIPEYTEEACDMQQKQCTIQEVENTSNLKMKITYLTSSNNTLKEEVANCKEKIKTLSIILQSKEIEWSEKEKKLTTEVAELKKCLEYNKKQNNSIINKNQSIFDNEEEKVEIQKVSSKENLSDLSKKKWELQRPIDSLVGVGSAELECNSKSFPTHELLNSALDKDIISPEMECENLSDEETITADINDILKEMRIHYRPVSPIPELQKDSVCFKNSTTTTTSELSKLQSSTKKISIAAKHESDIHNNSRNDRYNKQRQLKAKMFHKLITRKKAQNLYWKRKLEFIHKSETCNSKVKISKINTPKNDVDAPMKKNEKDYCLNKNDSVDSIITVLADLVSQKLKHPRTRKKSVRSNQCDGSVLEVNKMLLRKARQSMTNTIGYEKNQNSSSFERSSSELDIPIFDSCYESLNSNPPSIENIINDNKSKIDWQHQNKISSEGGNTGESRSYNMDLNVQESNKNGTNEKEKLVIIPAFGKERYSMSPQNSGNFQTEHELGSIHELISSNVGKKISKMNKIEENPIFEIRMNCLKDHCSNIQKDGLNEMQKFGNQKEMEKINGDVKPMKYTEPLEHVHTNNNLIMNDNLDFSLDHSQVQSEKFNLSLSSSGSEIHKNTKSAGNDNGENLSNTNEILEKDSKSAGNDKVESEISNSNKIEENSSFEGNANCLKDCSLNQYDAWNVAQKSRSYLAEIARNIDPGISPKDHIEPIEHVHQETYSLDIAGNLISQIQNGKYNNSNSGNSELEINKNTISVENENDKSENTYKLLEKNSTLENNVNCPEVYSFNIEDTQKFGRQFEEIAEKINEEMEPKKQTMTLDHVHPIINKFEIGDNLILGIEKNLQIQTRECDLKLNNSQLETDENIKSTENLKLEIKISNTNKTLKENISDSNLNCMKVHDLDILSYELNNSGLEADKNIKSTENVSIETEMSNTNKILREDTRFESNLNCMTVPNFNIQNDELIETQKCRNHFEEITERINENMTLDNLDHVHTIVKDLEISNNKHLEEITEKINEDIKPQKQTKALHYVHPVINNVEIGDNSVSGIEKNSLVQTRKYDLKMNNSGLETDKNIESTENVRRETEISNTNGLLREDTRFESNLNCIKVPNFNIQNDELIESQKFRSYSEEITEGITENMKPENLDHVHTIINNLEIGDNRILGIEENSQFQTRKCDFQLNNSQLEIKSTKNLDVETKISNTNEISKENTTFESNLNCLKVHDFDIQNDELIKTKKCQIHFEKSNEDVKPENLDHGHTEVTDLDLDIYETGSLSSSELEINKNIKASENDIKMIEIKNIRSVIPERSNIIKEYQCKSKMILKKNNEESNKNENINIFCNKMYHYRYEEDDKIKNNVKGGCNDRNIEIDKQNQCEDQKLNKLEPLCKLEDLNKNNETLQSEQSNETLITKYHFTEVVDLHASQIENKVCERNLKILHDSLDINESDIQNVESEKEDDKCKIEYSKEWDCSRSEKVLQKTEEYHDYLRSVNNSISDNIVHDQVQMKTDAELVGTTVSGMTEFQSVDSNNCYKIFHYDDNTSSELFDNYTDSNSTGAPERNSWKEPSNRSNESMWYDFGHNSLVDIRKSKSYHEGDVNYEQNLYTNDLETSNSNKLTSNKRFNEDELVNPSKIFKSEYVSSSCESVHSSPMEHETKYIQPKMKLYPSESKNTVNLTHESTGCKTKMSTNENMNKDWAKSNNNSVKKVKNDNDDDLVKSCELNFITDMDIDFNISQPLLEENCLNLYPSIFIPPMINNLSGDPECIHTNYLEGDDSMSKKNQTQCSENLSNVDSNSNKSIISEDCINGIESNDTTFSKSCNSNCTKLGNVQLEQCINDKKTPCKRKSSRYSKTISKVVVSNYNLRKSSKFKKEKNIFVPSAGDNVDNISLNTSDVNNTCVEVKETSGTGLNYRKMDSVLTSNEETDLFGSLSESSDNELPSSRNPNKMSKIVLENKKPCPLPPETMKNVSPNYSNNVACQNDENTSSSVYFNCIESKNLQEFIKDTDLFGSLSESSDNECSVSSNCTKMLKTLGTNHILQKTLKQEEEINPAPVASEMLKNVSFNSSHETGSQDFNKRIDSFGENKNLSETSNDGFCSNEFDTNCKPTTPKRRRKSYKCNTQQRKKKVAKKGLLMKKSIRTYKDKNLALNSAENKIIFHNENIIKTYARSNIEERLENKVSTNSLLNQCDSYFPKNGNISEGVSHYKNIETSSDSQNKESKHTENDSINLQSTIFKRSKNSSGTYSINSIRPTSGLKNIPKKFKKDLKQTSSSTSSNGIHDVKDKQNIEELSTSDNLQHKNVILNMESPTTAICEDSEKNYDIALKTATTTYEDSTQNFDTSSIKIRQSLMNPANGNEHKCSKKNLKLKSRYSFFSNDSKSGNKDTNNPSEIPLTLNKANITNSYPKEEKINILQEVVIRPSKANPKKFEIHAPAQMRISGFKRPNNSKIIPPCPLSPPPPTAEEIVLPVEPIIIPLEKPAKMETSKAAALFRKLITYSKEEKTVEEISRQFTSQDVDHISRLILEQITQDTEKANKDDTSAPLMTDTQRVMLGFMLKLEQMNVENLITTYLKISEARLLQVDTLQEIDKITRLYVAICKSHKYIGRIRRMCCDAFYFMGDFAIPFFFIVLVSWIQVLPMEEEMENFPMVKVLIQLVNLKSCNFPGYNLLPLRDLLNKYYKYPIEPWNTDNFFRELFNNYMKNPVRPNDFAILLYCKNNSSKWVYEKINTLIRPTLEIIKKENLKATVIILISNIISQFNGKLDGEYVDSARQWLKCMIEGEDVTEVIKESIIISLRKLPKTQKNLKVAIM